MLLWGSGKDNTVKDSAETVWELRWNEMELLASIFSAFIIFENKKIF